MKTSIGIFLFFASSTATMAQSDIPANAFSSDAVPAYTPITAAGRAHWVLSGTFGLPNLTAGVVSSGWSTMTNSPKEWGPHWDGFGKRYGGRLADGISGGTIEAGLGSMWGEDPRYFRAAGKPFGRRMGHVFASTFTAHDRNGNAMPAYARYIAIPANDFLSSTWRPPSHATVNHTLVRIPLAFLNRIISNTFSEFWPDVREHFFHRKDSPEN